MDEEKLRNYLSKDLSNKERLKVLNLIHNEFEGENLDRALSLFWEMTH